MRATNRLMSSTITDHMPGKSRQQLYDVMTDESLSLAEKQQRALTIGCDVLDVENGHIQRIKDEHHHEITASAGTTIGPLAEGAVVNRATTYCRRTLQRDSPLALTNASTQGWSDDPAYQEHELECYLGTTIFVDGDPYGTVCFISRDPRPEAFSPTERMFIELLARLIGREIESNRLNNQLTSQQRAREQSEAKYEAVLQAAPAALFLADTETGETVEVNDRATDLVGYAREELIGMDQSELHAPEQREQYQEELQRFFAADGTIDHFTDGTPLYFQHKNGTTIPVEISTSLVAIDGEQYVLGLVQDISDRRERQEELRVKNRAMNEASVGITIADAQTDDLPLVYANQAFEDLTGYDADAALGRNCRFLQGAETDEETVAVLREAMQDQEPVTTELVNYRADGTPFWNQLTVAPVENSTGEITHFIGVQQDVTARKRRQRLIRLLNRVLRHNLRNDMTAVMGYADILADRHDDETAEYAERIANTARDLVGVSEKAQTIEQNIRGVDTDRSRERNLMALLEEVAASLRADYPDATITVQSQLRSPEMSGVMVSGRFGEALAELGRNAIEHGDPEPTVTFGVDLRRGESGGVEIVVRDNGPGLPVHEQRVLERGEETPLEHGDGIGLWLVNWLTTGMGGSVAADVDSQGTAIRLQFPANTDRSETSESHRTHAAAICLQG